MRILISGSTGLIASALIPALERSGNTVTRLVRGPSAAAPAVVAWDPIRQTIDRSALEGFDAVVHLAGEPLLGRWTAAKKRRIAESRVGSTRFLSESLAGLARRPAVLVCASAAGYYGDRGDEMLTEGSPRGVGYLADLCEQWEAAAEPARAAGTRIVHVRTGLALARNGGLLKTMLLPFRLGLGGPIGRGRAYWSWIAIDDLVAVYRFALARAELVGAIIAASPNPVTNADFTRALGAVLHRPTVLPVPPLALRIVFGGEAAGEMLSGTRLSPARLLAAGFRFQYPDLEPALRHVLGQGQLTADS